MIRLKDGDHDLMMMNCCLLLFLPPELLLLILILQCFISRPRTILCPHFLIIFFHRDSDTKIITIYGEQGKFHSSSLFSSGVQLKSFIYFSFSFLCLYFCLSCPFRFSTQQTCPNFCLSRPFGFSTQRAGFSSSFLFSFFLYFFQILVAKEIQLAHCSCRSLSY